VLDTLLGTAAGLCDTRMSHLFRGETEAIASRQVSICYRNVGLLSKLKRG